MGAAARILGEEHAIRGVRCGSDAQGEGYEPGSGCSLESDRLLRPSLHFHLPLEL